MRADQKAIQDAWEKIWQHGYGRIAATLVTQTNGTKCVTIEPTPRTRLRFKKNNNEPKPKKTLTSTDR